jgi:hypothetical protein
LQIGEPGSRGIKQRVDDGIAEHGSLRLQRRDAGFQMLPLRRHGEW